MSSTREIKESERIEKEFLKVVRELEKYISMMMMRWLADKELGNAYLKVEKVIRTIKKSKSNRQ
jgi:hypothetical protein